MTQISKASMSKRRDSPKVGVFKMICLLVLLVVSALGFFSINDKFYGIAKIKKNLRDKKIVHGEVVDRLKWFPQSIGEDEWEIIPHPATLFMKKDENAENTENTENMMLKVPKFWNPALSSNGIKTDIRSYLGNNGQRLMTMEEAAHVGSFTDVEGESMETIFISIASYRDYRCPLTVENLFIRARYPERIRVALVDQIINDEDEPCNLPPSDEPSCAENPNHALCKYAHLISYYSMDASISVGPILARHIGHRMYRGEYFAMQIDAHMEFVDGWDVDIVYQWKTANNEMAILSTYVTAALNTTINVQTGQSLVTKRPFMCNSIYESDYYDGDTGHMRHDQQPLTEPTIHGTPMLHPFWAAGFSFARGHFVVNVPYDQYLPMIFQGEEPNIGIRAFTYGYDFYAPEQNIVFHYYDLSDRKGMKKKEKKVKIFWEHEDKFKDVAQSAMLRLKGIIDTNPEVTPDQWNHIEHSKYGTGKVRTTTKYFETFGIHPHNHTVGGTNLCSFVEMEMHLKFSMALRNNNMGIDYDQISFKFQSFMYPPFFETNYYGEETDDAEETDEADLE